MTLPFPSMPIADFLLLRLERPHVSAGKTQRLANRYGRLRCQPSTWRGSLIIVLVAAAAVGATGQMAARASAAPAPEVEYLYDVAVRRHYNFPNSDALAYGRGICEKVSQGKGYAQVMSDVKAEVTPSDEFAANYLISYAVNLLCPVEIWQLRNSAQRYQPPPG